MKSPLPFHACLLACVAIWTCPVAVQSAPDASREVESSSSIQAQVRPWMDSLDLQPTQQKELMTALQASSSAPGWPADLEENFKDRRGVDTARKLLLRHGYLAEEVQWLDSLPENLPPSWKTSMVVWHTRQLLNEGPASIRMQWPKWMQGDTPGEASNPEKIRSSNFLESMGYRNGMDLESLLDSFIPQNVVYRELHASFLDRENRMDSLMNEHMPIPPIGRKDIIKPGDRYHGATILQKRLIEEGYAIKPTHASEPTGEDGDKQPIYTLEMSEAVKRFQFHHGREADGILGPDTFAELNRSPEDESKLLRLNLHRARMLPDSPGNRYLIVNIPSASVLAFTKAPMPKVRMKAIVGESIKQRQTPVFRDIMETVEFGPYWNVPVNIAQKEILPKARKDRGYLERNHFEIVSNFKSDQARPVTAGTLSQAESGKLLIRQKPGPDNALGSVKFLFPNDFHIYLHDTPQGQLFDEAQRDFSHGCIRVEKPADLAEYVLAPQGWTRDRIEQAMASGVHQEVAVEHPVHVYIVYLTAFPTWDTQDKRNVRFHPDLYRHDTKQLLEE